MRDIYSAEMFNVLIFYCSYRGVVLFPWSARVFDRDLHHPHKPTTPKITETAAAEKIGQTSTVTDAVHPKTNANAAPTASAASSASTATTANAASATNTGSTTKISATSTANNRESSKEVKGKVQNFYQVLIDARDCPYIVSKLEIYLPNSIQLLMILFTKYCQISPSRLKLIYIHSICHNSIFHLL